MSASFWWNGVTACSVPLTKRRFFIGWGGAAVGIRFAMDTNGSMVSPRVVSPTCAGFSCRTESQHSAWIRSSKHPSISQPAVGQNLSGCATCCWIEGTSCSVWMAKGRHRFTMPPQRSQTASAGFCFFEATSLSVWTTTATRRFITQPGRALVLGRASRKSSWRFARCCWTTDTLCSVSTTKVKRHSMSHPVPRSARFCAAKARLRQPLRSLKFESEPLAVNAGATSLHLKLLDGPKPVAKLGEGFHYVRFSTLGRVVLKNTAEVDPPQVLQHESTTGCHEVDSFIVHNGDHPQCSYFDGRW
eukprot:Rhum_TRINITY_DN4637_c0_g1::Rhum_TRINITY_DN4637_c0_g1_i1::g.15162::m.15162